jgi:KaiC/GvpD/RAD55 family RecA-like ATPase
VLDIPEIDAPLGTALPTGWLALLTGTTGAGAPLLAKQFAQAGVGRVPVLFYTTYERTDEVRRSFHEFGWDPAGIQIVNLADEYYERVLVRGLDAARARERGLTLEQLAAAEPRDRPRARFSLTDRMLADLAGIDAPFRLVIDSLDFFFEVLGPKDVMKVAREVRHCCRSVGGQALLAVHAARHEGATGGLLVDLADLVLELRSEPKGGRFEHTLLVEKVGHRPDLARVVPVRLGDTGWEIPDGGKPHR